MASEAVDGYDTADFQHLSCDVCAGAILLQVKLVVIAFAGGRQRSQAEPVHGRHLCYKAKIASPCGESRSAGSYEHQIWATCRICSGVRIEEGVLQRSYLQLQQAED
jgi:hypothetical protein